MKVTNALKNQNTIARRYWEPAGSSSHLTSALFLLAQIWKINDILDQPNN